MVANRFEDHFGDIEPFTMPVTRHDALAVLDHFMTVCLPSFGDYQDALAEGEAFLFHSTLSAVLNCGLLTPDEVCEAAEAAYLAGGAAAECRGGLHPADTGVAGSVCAGSTGTPCRITRRATRWVRTARCRSSTGSAQTDMACVRDAVRTTRRHAYAHHIQRLMVTGNFALLAGLSPDEVNRWYMEVYADAYEWVELPNTHGMALFADGGIMGVQALCCLRCVHQPDE